MINSDVVNILWRIVTGLFAQIWLFMNRCLHKFIQITVTFMSQTIKTKLFYLPKKVRLSFLAHPTIFNGIPFNFKVDTNRQQGGQN